MKPIHPHDDLLRSVHRNQFAPRRSDLPHGYFDPPPWMTRTPVRWAVIAVIAICAYAMCAIQGDLSDEEIPYATTKACMAWAGDRTRWEGGADMEVQGVDDSVRVLVSFRKKRAPRKPKSNGVASAAPLSDAEQRFG